MDYSTAPASIERRYAASPARYASGDWRTVGASGLTVSAVTVGTWQNFSDLDPREAVRSLYLTAFDHGVFAFDFGNNYGRPPGSSEALFGSFLKDELKPYRRELVISTKAGCDMWPGPNGVGSSLKYMISSLDESLARLGLDYVDIFYSHRYDGETPLEETADALDLARRSGRCLYVGISSYPAGHAETLGALLAARGTPLLINQSHYNMMSRYVEDGVLDVCRRRGVGFAAFSPLAQGLLSAKHLDGVPAGRAAEPGSSGRVNDRAAYLTSLRSLQALAQRRGQSLAQMAISWTLRDPAVCTAVIGVRTPEQLLENLRLDTAFSAEEDAAIARACADVDVNLWKPAAA